MTRTKGQALTGNELREYWERNYSDCPPIGYLLREKFPDRWFRIHTLPGAKRYAESLGEQDEILRRHDLFLSSLLGQGKPYVLITTGYSNSARPIKSYPEVEELVGPSEFWFTVPLHDLEGESDQNYWHFFFTEKTWTAQSASELLKLVAEGSVSNVLFLGIKNDAIYHPYDGGADILVGATHLKSRLKQQYQSWLSTHAQGL